MTAPTFERLKGLIANAPHIGIEPENITPTATFANDLGFDSIDHMELIMAAEEEWDVEIGDEDAERCLTVADAVALIDRLTGVVA